MASSRQRIHPTDEDFENIARRWYEEVESDFGDQDDYIIQDPDYYSDHDSTSEIDNNNDNDNSASEEELEPEMEEINARAYYGKDRFKWSMSDILGLKNVTLYIEPSIVQLGNSSTLRCTYDLEGDKLYSVKWYRGRYEFYRYDPTGYPVTQFFPLQGFTPDLPNSNSTQVVLKDIEFNLAGNFSCEVTTDGPNFHTRTDSKSMLVVQLPEHPPQISVGREPLDYGDILRANCSSYQSRPPADLKFILNNITVNQSDPFALRRANLRDWSDLQLELKLSFMHFNEGRLVLQCVAQISSIYQEVAELELESVRHPVPARVSAPSNAATPALAEIRHTIKLGAYSVLLLAFVLARTCY